MIPFSYQPPNVPLVFLHVDDHFLVLDKPSGLLTVPGRGEDRTDCLLNRVRQQYPEALTVHRLDLATSGIVVMGRGPKAQRELSILFQDRKVDKRYEALVDGQWSIDPEGEISQPLIVDWPNRPKQKIDHVEGRPSLTHYRLISVDTENDTSRVALFPYTGRSHQLRVHMAHVGHPILGDDLYGSIRTYQRAPRLMLHACEIAFPHPVSGAAVRFVSPAPF
jgi:tRNA pseudouridine32 synthase/23S rRNA pseudouridine746 synthase